MIPLLKIKMIKIDIKVNFFITSEDLGQESGLKSDSMRVLF